MQSPPNSNNIVAPLTSIRSSLKCSVVNCKEQKREQIFKKIYLFVYTFFYNYITLVRLGIIHKLYTYNCT